MSHELSFANVQDVMSDAGAVFGAAESHGLLAGLLCVDQRARCEQWLALVLDEEEVEALAHQERSCLKRLYEQTRAQLADPNYGLRLLLPDEDAELNERVEALGDWCRGFLCGIGYTRANAEWPADSAEVLRDLVEISHLDTDASGEADEQAFAEITEFVRMGVYLVRAELDQAASPTVH